MATQTGVTTLTPPRALVAEMVRRYWVLGIECTTGAELAGEHEDPLDLRFSADKYGPYSDRLRHLLNGLDGSYLQCDKRLSDAGSSDTIWFDEERPAFLDLYLKQSEQRPLQEVLDRTAALIDGFDRSARDCWPRSIG